jgi:hypothetical protein
MTTSASSTTNLTIEATNDNGSYNSDIIVDADGVVHLRSNVITNTYAGAGIQIGTDLSAVDISIGHTTSDVRIGDDLYVTGDGTVTGNLTVTGTLSYGAAALSSQSFSGTAPYLTFTNTTEENTDPNGSSGASSGRESQIIFKGEKADGTAHELATIMVAHEGTGDDYKGQIQFFTNSGAQGVGALSNAMNILDTGRVGIGVFSPNQLLGIVGANAQISIEEDDSAFLRLGVGESDGTAVIGYDDGDKFQIGVYSSPTDTSIAPYMTIDSTGNVGIGVTDPDGMLEIVQAATTGHGLHVSRDLASSSTNLPLVRFDQTNTGDDQNVVNIRNDGTGDCLTLDNDGGEIAVFGYNGGGNVGIGTTSPDSVLEVASTSAAPNISIQREQSNLTDGNTVGTLSFRANTTDVAKVVGLVEGTAETSGDLTFETAAGSGLVERMRILSSGNVGIGIADPDAALHVEKEIADDGVLCNFVYMKSGTNQVDAGDTILKLSFGDTVAEAGTPFYATFHDSGSTNGSITWDDDNTVAFATSSDYRIKSNIEPMDGSLSDINKLKPSSFNIRKATTKGYGFIAHELQEIYPTAVTGKKDAVDKDGEILPQQVAYGKLVPFLVKAIQELSAKVTALENA